MFSGTVADPCFPTAVCGFRLRRGMYWRGGCIGGEPASGELRLGFGFDEPPERLRYLSNAHTAWKYENVCTDLRRGVHFRIDQRVSCLDTYP